MCLTSCWCEVLMNALSMQISPSSVIYDLMVTPMGLTTSSKKLTATWVHQSTSRLESSPIVKGKKVGSTGVL